MAERELKATLAEKRDGVGKKFFLNDIICPLNDDFCCP